MLKWVKNITYRFVETIITDRNDKTTVFNKHRNQFKYVHKYHFDCDFFARKCNNDRIHPLVVLCDWWDTLNFYIKFYVYTIHGIHIVDVSSNSSWWLICLVFFFVHSGVFRAKPYAESKQQECKNIIPNSDSFLFGPLVVIFVSITKRINTCEMIDLPKYAYDKRKSKQMEKKNKYLYANEKLIFLRVFVYER